MNRLRQRLRAGSACEQQAGSGHREECSEAGLWLCQTSEECLLLVTGSDEAMSHAANAPGCSLARLGLNDTKQTMMYSCAMAQCSLLQCYSKTNMLHEPSFGKWISVFFCN